MFASYYEVKQNEKKSENTFGCKANFEKEYTQQTFVHSRMCRPHFKRDVHRMNNTLTEKYRPKTFDQIIGNRDIMEKLENLAKRPEGQVPTILLLQAVAEKQQLYSVSKQYENCGSAKVWESGTLVI